MGRNCRLLVVALGLLAAPWTSAAPAHLDGERLARLVEDGMAEWHVPGMAVAVIDGNELVFRRGFGRTAVDGGHPVDEHTLFANASTTKAMIVAGLLILADEGRLSLADPVIRYIPELHFHPAIVTGNVTLEDLLAHRTGLPSTDAWAFLTLLPLDEQIRRLRLVEPVAGPRERLIYQNTMYQLAGLVIERVSGKRWDRFLAERLWRPIGMRETYGTRADIPRRAHHVLPHEYLGGEIREIPWDWPADLADAAGSVWSSIRDMSLWAQFLLRGGVTGDGHRLVSEAGMRAMFEPRQLATPDDFYPTVRLTEPHWRTYGLGWFQQDFQGRAIDFHTGSLGGLIAIIGLDRAQGRAVVVMGNRDHAELRHALLWDVMDDTEGESRRDWSREVLALYEGLADERAAEWTATEQSRLEGTAPSLPLERYAGTYRNDVFGDLLVELEDGQLTAHAGISDFTLSHWHLDTFLVSHPSWRYGQFATFPIGPEGDVLALEAMGLRFERVAD